MHDYIKQLYDEASENGSPLIRTMFYEFPDDKKCWELQDQYMFGSEYLVAPIFHLNEFEREVYIFRQDAGKTPRDGKVYEGGQTIRAAAPVDSIPVFKKNGIRSCKRSKRKQYRKHTAWGLFCTVFLFDSTAHQISIFAHLSAYDLLNTLADFQRVVIGQRSQFRADIFLE